MGIIYKNQEIGFNYEILNTYEAGVVLTGPEVKSVKSGQLSLKGSYVTIDPKGEAWLINGYIAAYKPAQGHQLNYNTEQRRKLLLHKKEINSLIGKSRQKGLTIVPLSVYTKKGLIKVSLALVKGKSKIDKRETIKKREINRQIQRTLRQK